MNVNDIQLYHNSFVSLHVQLHHQVQQLILSGRWMYGTRLPSENQLTSHLKISRSTVRLALQQIEIEGLIERIPGKGTFVAYQPSQGNRAQLIAFVTSDFNDAKALNLLNGAEDEMKTSGYRIMFSNAQNYREEIELLTRFQAENVAGVLIWPNSDYGNGEIREQHIKNYQSVQLPLVFLDRNIERVDSDCVTSDNYGGASALMQHLVELGHQHIAFVVHSKLDLMPVMERYRAYQEVMWKAGLTPVDPWIIGDGNGEINGNHALRSSTDHNSLELQQIKNYLLNAPHRPTAIFAINDFLAILTMRVMKFLGIKVPDEISIAGFDDIDLASHLEIPLTTVAQHPFEIGKRAARRLIDRLEGYNGPTSCEIISTQLRVRSSTSLGYVPDGYNP
ncbi:MAG TPA: GntR family transcriptional regulator [Phototrophicaceae bacterium]|jgi:GntR family transcriptional regulator of arabinose operon|nr:GntR family transcriptional regulator [Phototrophicaceae bacterium]